MGRACGTYREKGKACRVLVKNPEENKTLGSPSGTWEDNIEIGLEEFISSFAVRNIELAVERVGRYDLCYRQVATLQIVFDVNETELNELDFLL
jgi:hypothetical protein